MIVKKVPVDNIDLKLIFMIKMLPCTDKLLPLKVRDLCLPTHSKGMRSKRESGSLPKRRVCGVENNRFRGNAVPLFRFFIDSRICRAMPPSAGAR